MDTLVLFRELDLFKGLSDDELEICKQTFPMFKASAGRLLYTPAAEDEAMYILKKGSVRVYRLSRDGREVTLGTLEPGDVFGTLPVFGALSRASFAEAASDSLICKIDEDQLAWLLRRHPDVGLRLLRFVGERLASAEDQIEDLAFRSAEQRVARQVSKLLGIRNANRLFVSHEEIAKAAGVARETVTKIVGGWEREGLVKTGYRRLRVLDPASIDRRAAD